MSNNFFSFGTFTVDIEPAHNADVAENQQNVIRSNGIYPIPNGYTGWNGFEVNVQLPPQPEPEPLENDIEVSLPASPAYNQDNLNNPYTITIDNFQSNNLITFNEFDKEYATSIQLDLQSVIEKIFNDLKLEMGQSITENGEYQIYDYEKDDDLDIKKKVLRVSRDVIDDPSYRNIGSFVVNVQQQQGSPPLLQNKQVPITENGQTIVHADNGYDGLGTVTIDTNISDPLPPTVNLQEKTVNLTSNSSISVLPDTGYTGLSKVNINGNFSSTNIVKYFRLTNTEDDTFSDFQSFNRSYVLSDWTRTFEGHWFLIVIKGATLPGFNYNPHGWVYLLLHNRGNVTSITTTSQYACVYKISDPHITMPPLDTDRLYLSIYLYKNTNTSSLMNSQSVRYREINHSSSWSTFNINNYYLSNGATANIIVPANYGSN